MDALLRAVWQSRYLLLAFVSASAAAVQFLAVVRQVQARRHRVLTASLSTDSPTNQRTRPPVPPAEREAYRKRLIQAGWEELSPGTYVRPSRAGTGSASPAPN